MADGNLCTRIGRALGLKLQSADIYIDHCRFEGMNADGSPPIVERGNGHFIITLVGWQCFAPGVDIQAWLDRTKDEGDAA